MNNDPNENGHSGKHKVSTRNWIIGGLLLVLIVAAGAVAVWRGVATANLSGGSAADPVVVEMKPQNILRSSAQAYYEQLKADYESQGYDIADAGVITEMKTGALTAMAQRQIADDKIETLKLGTITDEDRLKAQQDAQEEFDQAVEMYAPYFQNAEGTLNDEELRETVRQYFKENNLSVEEVTSYYLSDIPTQRLLDSISKDVTVSDEEIQAEFLLHADADKETYENDIANYEINLNYYGTEILYRPAGFRGVRHILLAAPEDIQARLDTLTAELTALTDELFYLQNPDRTPGDNLILPTPPPDPTPEPTATPAPDTVAIAAKQAEVDAKSAQIEEERAKIAGALEPIIQEINDKLAAGESFLSLIDLYGTDPGMTEEPARTEGYPVHAQSILYDEAFHQGAMALAKIGDISRPILSSFGIHILEYTSDLPEGPIAMTDSIREEFRAEVLQEKQNAAIDAQFEIWMKDYGVVIHPELLD
ncbi:hypothetical protein AGMMS49992_23130 [Clostridia bacterium]|nr:hypothetical protein AGMMS49992_23130 [Clostridia bacterium]